MKQRIEYEKNKANLNLNSFEELGNCRGLKIVNLNVRTLYPKQAQLEAVITKGKIDVFGLCETWLSGTIHNNLLRIPDYKIYRHDRRVSKRGGGIATYVHKSLKVDANMYDNLNLSERDIELLILKVNQKCTKPYIIISMYRPLQGSIKRFIDKLRTTLV